MGWVLEIEETSGRLSESFQALRGASVRKVEKRKKNPWTRCIIWFCRTWGSSVPIRKTLQRMYGLLDIRTDGWISLDKAEDKAAIAAYARSLAVAGSCSIK